MYLTRESREDHAILLRHLGHFGHQRNASQAHQSVLPVHNKELFEANEMSEGKTEGKDHKEDKHDEDDLEEPDLKVRR